VLKNGFADRMYSYAGLKHAHGEVLSPEEEVALKLAEAELDRTQKGNFCLTNLFFWFIICFSFLLCYN